jgi:hypothetical protein
MRERANRMNVAIVEDQDPESVQLRVTDAPETVPEWITLFPRAERLKVFTEPEIEPLHRSTGELSAASELVEIARDYLDGALDLVAAQDAFTRVLSGFGRVKAQTEREDDGEPNEAS